MSLQEHYTTPIKTIPNDCRLVVESLGVLGGWVGLGWVGLGGVGVPEGVGVRVACAPLELGVAGYELRGGEVGNWIE